jgi:hypothetical protein
MFELNTVRSTISLHAITSSVLNQLKKDTFQRQIEIIFNSNIFNSNILNNGLSIPCDNEILKVYILNTLIFVLAWWGYERYASRKSVLYKLNNFIDFKEKQRIIKMFILVIIFIFCRNVENAI